MVDWLMNASADAADTVCQDWGAVLYGHYKGRLVPLVPVGSAGAGIEDWIPDPEICAMVDSRESITAVGAVPVKRDDAPTTTAEMRKLDLASLGL